MKNIPVYRFPAEHALENGELELYRASNKASAACKEAMVNKQIRAIRGKAKIYFS